MKNSVNYIKDYFLKERKSTVYTESDSVLTDFGFKELSGLRAAVISDNDFRSVKKEINFMIYRLLKNGKEKEAALKKEIEELKNENAELRRKAAERRTQIIPPQKT